MKNILRTLICLEMFFKSARTNIGHFQNFQLEQKFLKCSWIFTNTNDKHLKNALTNVLKLFLNPF